MSLHTLVQLARRRWQVLARGPVVALSAWRCWPPSLMTPAYESADHPVRVGHANRRRANDLLQGNNFTQARVRSYVDLVTTDAVLGPVIRGRAWTPRWASWRTG